MERLIKFRGKSLSTGEWVYGYYYVNTLGMHNIVQENGQTSEVDPKTVGQYIGQQDKNDREIYEGDIATAYFLSFDFEGNDTGEIQTVVIDDITDIRRVLRDVLQSTLEIIGNIHNPIEDLEVCSSRYDHPDLLTQ